MDVILASGSLYKTALLQRLRVPFSAIAAQVDESAHPHESAETLACRLADLKAAALRAAHPQAILIGADQVASSASMPHIGKPGSREANFEQLKQLSGQRVAFLTAVTVSVPVSTDGPGGGIDLHRHLDTTHVTYRRLEDRDISRYLDGEDGSDCAGGCKVEGLGITLLQSVESVDPTALIGLPLIALSGIFRRIGLS